MCKRLVFVFLCVSLMGAVGFLEAKEPDPSLMAWWRLDEGTGRTAGDASGNGNDGTFVGNPTWVPGQIGGALEFDGGGAYVDCGDGDSINITGPLTLSVWAKSNVAGEGGANVAIACRADDGSSWAWQLRYNAPGGGNYMGFQFNATPGGSTWVSVGEALTPNQWYHIAAIFDGAEVKCYLNGVETASAAMAAIAGGASRFYLGQDGWLNVYNGAVDEMMVFARALTVEELLEVMEGASELSSEPSPEDGAVDVPLDVVLGWAPGELAATHDVYFGTVLDDVNDATRDDPRDVLFTQSQSAETCDPDGLEYGRTYYWRVDEVNAAPDYAIFKGEVWTFTAEPMGYPVTGVVATTNAECDAGSGPERTIDGSGLDADDRHSVEAGDMWLAQSGDGPVTIQYEFDRLCQLHELWIWNYNSAFELILGFGLKEVTVEYSVDGADWVALGEMELAQATGVSTYTANTVVDLSGIAARFVRLTVGCAWGTMGAQCGLSEVRFLYIPVQARAPQPADGQTEVAPDAVLTWRAGRGAVSHRISLGIDADAVLTGTAPAETIAENAFGTRGLDFGTTYYWKVDEAGGADGSDVWEGDLWSFTTQEFAMVDDFESYDNEDDRIYDTWIDGWVNETGSIVGYMEEPFAEQAIVHGGNQSMPLEYNNAAGPYYSEAERDLTAANWTLGQANTLRLYVQGSVDNDPGTFYVALEDSAGHTAMVAHPDQAVVTTDAWQEWTIPFDSFTGVNPAAIRMIYVGVGDRDNPTAGGSGLIFIDDIQFGKPVAN